LSYRTAAKSFIDWWEENNGKPPTSGELKGLNTAFAHATDEELSVALNLIDADLLEGVVKRINVVAVRQYIRKAHKLSRDTKPQVPCEMCLGTGWMDVIMGVDESGTHWTWTQVPGRRPHVFNVNCPCPNGVGSRVDNAGRLAWKKYFGPHRWRRGDDGRLLVKDGKRVATPTWYMQEHAIAAFEADPLRVLRKAVSDESE
jgi:hypothetical protein